MNQNFMKEKPVMPLVISMALPMTFSMLVNALYNIIDSYFVARISEDAMTALSLVFPLQNLVNAVVIGYSNWIFSSSQYAIFILLLIPAFLLLFTHQYEQSLLFT